MEKLQIKYSIYRTQIQNIISKQICKDRIWVGPKIGLDFNPISPNNKFVESE